MKYGRMNGVPMSVDILIIRFNWVSRVRGGGKQWKTLIYVITQIVPQLIRQILKSLFQIPKLKSLACFIPSEVKVRYTSFKHFSEFHHMPFYIIKLDKSKSQVVLKISFWTQC